MSDTVAELSSVVRAYEEMQDETLRWVDVASLRAEAHSVDVLYINSALQYMPDNEVLLRFG